MPHNSIARHTLIISDLDVDIDAALPIAVPTIYHRAIAEPLLSRGVAVLVEKPIAPDVTEATALLECSKKYDALLQIGHSERY